MKSSARDPWAQWLLHDRHGGDSEHERGIRNEVDRYADRLIKGLRLKRQQTLLDIGTGDGLVALRAIGRIGPTLSVILTDVSEELLVVAQRNASALGVERQCTFLRGSAERLESVETASVDAVSMRAVLAHVDDKSAALAEAFRVLRRGGRISLADPMLQDDALDTAALRQIVESDEAEGDPALRLLHRWKSAQFPDTLEGIAASCLTRCSERDLLNFARACGFADIRLELHLSVRRVEAVAWNTFLASSPHPLAPTLFQILDERFDAVERREFERLFRPAVEAGGGQAVERIVYMSAVKP